MRVIVLFLLSLLLGALVYLNFTMTKANKVSKDVQKVYLKHEYIITKKDDTGYYGKSADGISIYFKKENLHPGQNLLVDDQIIVYFDKEDRKDGLVKIEEK